MSLTTLTHVLRDSANRLLPGRPISIQVGGDTGDGEGWRPLQVIATDGSEIDLSATLIADEAAAFLFSLIPNTELAPTGSSYRIVLPSGDTHLFVVPVSVDPVPLSSLYTSLVPLVESDAAQLTAEIAGLTTTVTANTTALASLDDGTGHIPAGKMPANTAYTQFDATFWERKSLDLPGGSWQNSDGVMVVPPALAADNALGAGVNWRDSIAAVMTARQAVGYGGEFYFRNDEQWVLNGKQTWPDMRLGQCIRLYDRMILSGNRTEFLMRAALGSPRPRAIGCTLRPGFEQQPAQTDSKGTIIGGIYNFYTTAAVPIDTAFQSGTWQVHVSTGTRQDGLPVAVGNRVFLSLGEPTLDVKEPDYSQFAQITGLIPDGGSLTTTPGATCAGPCTIIFDQPIAYSLNPATDTWMFRAHLPAKNGIYPKATGLEDPNLIARNYNSMAVFIIDPLYDVKYTEVDGIHVIGETAQDPSLNLSGAGIAPRWTRSARIANCAVKNWGQAIIPGYCDGDVIVDNCRMLGETAANSGELINAVGRTTRVLVKGGYWQNGTNRMVEAQHGAYVFIDGAQAKNWNPYRPHTLKSMFNVDQGDLIEVSAFDFEGAGTLFGTPGGTGLTASSRVRFYKSLEIRCPDPLQPMTQIDTTMLDENCQLRVSGYNAVGDPTTYRRTAFASADPYRIDHKLTPATSGTLVTAYPLPYGILTNRSKILASSLTGVPDISFDPGPATGLLPQSISAVNVTDALVTTEPTTGISVFSSASRAAGTTAPWSPKSSPGTEIVLPQTVGAPSITSVGMVNGLNCPDVVATAGSANVTSPGGFFTPGMVGMWANTSAGANHYFGSGGGRTSAKITAVADANHATLSLTVNTSFTGLFVQARVTLVDGDLANGNTTVTSDSGSAVFPASMVGARVALLDPRGLPYLTGPVKITAVAADHKSATLSAAPTGIPGSVYTGLLVEDQTGTAPASSVQLIDTYTGARVLDGTGGDDPATIGSGIAAGVPYLLPDTVTNLGTNGAYNQGILDPLCAPQLLVTTDTTCSWNTMLTLMLDVRELTSEPGLPVPQPTSATVLQATDGPAFLRGGTVEGGEVASSVYKAAMTVEPTPISNTTTLTPLWTPPTISPAQVTVGSTFRLRVGGLVTTQATSGTFTYRIKIGSGAALLSVTLLLSMTTGQTNLPWFCDHDIEILATGSSGSVVVTGHAQGYNVAGTSVLQTGNGSPTSVDLSAPFTIVPSIQMATASATNSFAPQVATLTQIV